MLLRHATLPASLVSSLRSLRRHQHAGVIAAARAAAQSDLDRIRTLADPGDGSASVPAGPETEPLPRYLAQPSVLSAAVAGNRRSAPALPSECYADLVSSGRLSEDAQQVGVLTALDSLSEALPEHQVRMEAHNKAMDAYVEQWNAALAAIVDERVAKAEADRATSTWKVQAWAGGVIRSADSQLYLPARMVAWAVKLAETEARALTVTEDEVSGRVGTAMPVAPASPRGLYIHGSVGTGKSLCMDVFFAGTEGRVRHRRRVHFNTFMMEVQSRLHRYSQTAIDGGREGRMHIVLENRTAREREAAAEYGGRREETDDMPDRSMRGENKLDEDYLTGGGAWEGKGGSGGPNLAGDGPGSGGGGGGCSSGGDGGGGCSSGGGGGGGGGGGCSSDSGSGGGGDGGCDGEGADGQESDNPARGKNVGETVGNNRTTQHGVTVLARDGKDVEGSSWSYLRSRNVHDPFSAVARELLGPAAGCGGLLCFDELQCNDPFNAIAVRDSLFINNQWYELNKLHAMEIKHHTVGTRVFQI